MGTDSDFLSDGLSELPFETSELRKLLDDFLNKDVEDPYSQKMVKLGNYKYGIYSFYDYDNEPIYVGQTSEKLRTRIRRHLTNQRTDAVAMNVLDPFEVYKIVVYPVPEPSMKGKNVKEELDALERRVYDDAIKKSKFEAILNEKEPPVASATATLEMPASHEGVIVSEAVMAIRKHPDVRIARRSQTISRLAQVISERKVQNGLRCVLLTQAKRLQWLAQRRVNSTIDKADDDDE
ncbi:GIY-YIG nuclease family protein [Aeromonas veronii]|uniref:GIY-YIG nuclease family protein n=1 Tax=Aeromonas veronii TaxID=654 RepID=UPI001116F0DD|nr:GIY-YIG nuclease family protein [Aeromonas veronii]TNI06621.1 excinuclease ABC subunit C [Aeromonas veronii]HDO1314049.1 GIY-YIG nuclease family protein [Aeromonas veronii]